MALRQNNANGDIKWLLDKSLQVTMFIPKIVYAEKEAKFPKILFLSNPCLLYTSDAADD